MIPLNQVHGPYKTECALKAVRVSECVIVCIREGQVSLTQPHFQSKIF